MVKADTGYLFPALTPALGGSVYTRGIDQCYTSGLLSRSPFTSTLLTESLLCSCTLPPTLSYCLIIISGFLKFYFSKCAVGGTHSCIFTSSWGLGVFGVNYLISVLWNQFNKSFTKEFLKGCSGQGTTNLQSLRDHSWSYKLIVGNFFTEFVICCFVKQD